MKEARHKNFIVYDFVKIFKTRQNGSVGTEMKTVVVKGR